MAVAPAPVAPAPVAVAPAVHTETPATTAVVPGFLQGSGFDADMEDPNRSSGGGQGGKRLWMPKGQAKNIIFLSDGTGPLPYGPPVIYEHQPPLGQGKKRWQNWAPCLEPLGVPCPLCEFAAAHDKQGQRYKGMFFSILDLSEWTDGKGVKHSMTKRIMVAKKDTKEKIERKYMTRVEAGGTLRGSMFKVFRGNTDKSASVGDDFEFVQACDMNSLPEDMREPFDVMEFLGLNDPEKVKANVADMVQRMKVELGEAGAPVAAVPGAQTPVAY